SLHVTVDRHGLVFVGPRSRSGVVEGDAGAIDAAAVHGEATSVDDVGAGLEGHVGGAPGPTLTVNGETAVDPGVESVCADAVDAGIGVVARQRERGSGEPGERVRLPRNTGLRRRGEAGTRHAPGDGDRGRARDAGAAAFVQRVAVVRIVNDPAVGVDVGAPVQVDRFGGRWVQRIDTVPRILDARDRPRAHHRALEAEDAHEYRRAGLGDDGLHERVINRIA